MTAQPSRAVGAVRRVPVTQPISERVLAVCASFGMMPVDGAHDTALPDAAWSLLADQVHDDFSQRAGLGLLYGPSGSGKSSVLRALCAQLGGRAIPVQDILRELAQSTCSLVELPDLAAFSLHQALRALAAAGLGEAMLWTRTPRQLSDGERARCALACAMARASLAQGSWLLIDEFCSGLDTPTALGLSRTLRRWSQMHQDLRVVCATTRDDLRPALQPDRVWELAL